MAHTPGPWKVIDREVLDDGSVYPMHIAGGARELRICLMESLEQAEIPYSDKMVETADLICSKRDNAHLIAAAPQMLEALKKLLAVMEEVLRSDGGASAWAVIQTASEAKAAIAAAKGESC